MSNQTTFLTSKTDLDGQDYNTPLVIYLLENEIGSVKPRTKSKPGSPKTSVSLSTSSGGIGGVGAKVYESPTEIEVARDPATANIKAQSKSLALTATGANQGAALAASGNYLNEITGGAADTGVLLDAAVAGKVRVFLNNTISTKKIYPATGEAIGSGAANAAITMPAKSRTHFVSLEDAVWTVAIDNGQ